VSTTTRLPILSMAREIASFGVEDAGEALVVDDDRWSSLLQVLTTQRLSGLAVAALRDGRLVLSSAAEAELMGLHRGLMIRSLACERTLIDLAESFENIDVAFVVLKGPAVAHTAYPDPSWRPFGDLDVLVQTTDWERALAALAGLGFRRDLPEPRRGFDVRFGKAATHTDADGLQVDLHRTLALGPFGAWIDRAGLFAADAEFHLGGRSLRRLDDEAMFVHACVHASLGWSPPLLLPMRDVAQIASTLRIDPSIVSTRARSWRLGAVIEHAVRVTADLVGQTVPELSGVIGDVRSSQTERRALRAYTSGRRRRVGMAVSMLRAIPSLRSKAAYLRDLLLPSREFLAARSSHSGQHPSYARRLAVPFHWVAGRWR
jgi:hypothetical protein